MGCEVAIVNVGVLETKAALVAWPNPVFLDQNNTIAGLLGMVNDWSQGMWLVDTYRGYGRYKLRASNLRAWQPPLPPPGKPLPVCVVLAGVEGTGHHAFNSVFERLHQNNSEIWDQGKGVSGFFDYYGLPQAATEMASFPVDRRPVSPGETRSALRRRLRGGVVRMVREHPDVQVFYFSFVNSFPGGLVDWSLTADAGDVQGWQHVIEALGQTSPYREMRGVRAQVHRLVSGYRPDIPALEKAMRGHCRLRVLALRRSWEAVAASMVLRRSRVPLRTQVKVLETELIVLSRQLRLLRQEQWTLVDYDELVASPAVHLNAVASFLCVPQLAAAFADVGERTLKPPRNGTRERFTPLEHAYMAQTLSSPSREVKMWPALADRSQELLRVAPECGSDA